jgi:hypothetical protein
MGQRFKRRLSDGAFQRRQPDATSSNEVTSGGGSAIWSILAHRFMGADEFVSTLRGAATDFTCQNDSFHDFRKFPGFARPQQSSVARNAGSLLPPPTVPMISVGNVTDNSKLSGPTKWQSKITWEHSPM